jgi:diacylglycerol kinase (CTP)
MNLKARNDIHLARRLWHFFGAMLIFVLYVVVPESRRLATAVVLCTIPILLDLGRLYVPQLNRSLTVMFRPFMREDERDKPAALSSMLVGVLVLIIVFRPPVVALSILFLAVGDPLASYFGITYGKDKLIGNKSVQGTLAAFVSCFVMAVIYFQVTGLVPERRFIVCLLAGLIGAFSELIPIGKLDDNLVFPLMSGILLTGLLSLFGGL